MTQKVHLKVPLTTVHFVATHLTSIAQQTNIWCAFVTTLGIHWTSIKSSVEVYILSSWLIKQKINIQWTLSAITELFYLNLHTWKYCKKMLVMYGLVNLRISILTGQDHFTSLQIIKTSLRLMKGTVYILDLKVKAAVSNRNR